MDLINNHLPNELDREISQHGGNLYQEAKKLGFKANNILDASASVVPFRPPNQLLHYLKQSINSPILRNYPDRNYELLKESIANWHSIDSDMVLPGNGASELITWSGREASMTGLSSLPAPCFSDYERALRCWGGAYIHIPMKLRWGKDNPQSFAITAESKVMWITNPHNPTGQLWDRESLLPLLDKHDLVICDEAFLPLVPHGEKQSLIPLVSDYKNLIVIRSLTKLFAIAGLRIGYAITSKDRLQEWQYLRDPWPINGIAMLAGTMLMSKKELTTKWINKMHRWINSEGQWLYSKLDTLPGIKSHPSSTNFQLIEGEFSLLGLRQELAEKQILIRDCRSFKNLNSNWLRISLQTKSNNRKIFKSMSKILIDN